MEECRCSSTPSWPRHCIGLVVSLTLRPLYSKRTKTDVHWMWNCVYPRFSLDSLENRKISASTRKRTKISRTSNWTHEAKLDDEIAEKCETQLVMTVTDLCCIHEDLGVVGLNAVSAGKLFTVVFRTVVPPFRIKQFDEWLWADWIRGRTRRGAIVWGAVLRAGRSRLRFLHWNFSLT
jgi:hypothetical protein